MSAAAGCGCTCAVAWMVGRSPDASVGWRYVCFNHSVVRCHVFTCAVPSLLFSTSPYYSHLPPLPMLCYCLYIGMSPVWRHFMTALHAQTALVSGCSHCDINQMTQIRHFRYRSPVALSSRIVQITAHIFDVRYQYHFNTINYVI